MALSGSVSTSKYDGRYYTVSWTARQSFPSNQSTINWTLKAVGGNSSWYAERTLKVLIDGESVYSKTDRKERYAGTVATGSKVIKHDSSGKASFEIEIQAAVYVTTVNCTGSDTFDLNTIPRASTLTVSAGTLGTAQTLEITEQVSAFEHKLYYTCGDSGKVYILGSSSETSKTLSVDWTPPLSLASQNTTGTSVSISFTLQTYSGSTLVGSYTATKTFTIPASVKPSCSVEVTDSEGYADTYGGFIKGISKFKVVVTPTIAHGSPIASYSTTANGATYTVASFTTDLLRTAGTLKVSATVKDKRGRSGSASVSKTVLDYTPPIVSLLSVKRCDADGYENEKGEYVMVTFSGKVTGLNNKNSATYTLKYKKSTDTNYQTVPFGNLANSYSVSNSSYTFAADTGASYDIQLSIVDDFKTTTKNTSASTAFTLMHWNADGTGMAIGKIAEESNLFDVGLPTRFRNGITVDSEWTALTMNSSFKCYNDNPNCTPKYKVQGNIVTVKGVVAPVAEFASGMSGVDIATGIPTQFRPKNFNVYFICQGSDMNRWTCGVTTGGAIRLSRYGTTTATTVPTTAWLSFCVTYQV